MSYQRWRLLIPIVMCLLFPTGAVAQAKPSSSWDFVPGNAVGVASVRWAKVWRHEVVQKIRKLMPKDTIEFTKFFQRDIGISPKDVDRVSIVVVHVPLAYLPVVHVTTKKPYDKRQVLKRVSPQAKVQKYLDWTVHLNENERKDSFVFLHERAYVYGFQRVLFKYLDQLKAAKKGPLTTILNERNAKHTAFVAITNQPFRQAFGNTPPPFLRPFVPLLEAQLVTAALDVDQKIHGQLALHFANKDDAKAGQQPLQLGLDQIRRFINKHIKQIAKRPLGYTHYLKVIRDIERLSRKISVRQQTTKLETTLQVPWDTKILPKALAEMFVALRVEGQRNVSANNLHQLALAAHDYHSVHKRLPAAAVYDKNGKPLLSWRVLLLPYLGEDELYRKFRLHEPWDSPHNKKLLIPMPKIFALPVGKHPPNLTFYQAVVGKGTVFESRRGLRLTKITNADGTSNTVLFVEAKTGVPWTKPADVNYTPGKKIPPLGGHFSGGFHAVLCDGSTRFLSSKLRTTTLRFLFSWNDGMVLPAETFK